MSRVKPFDIDKSHTLQVHGKDTSVRWLVNNLLQWFGPFDTRVETGLPCMAPGCNGRLVHAYESVEIGGRQYKVVFTKTNKGTIVTSKVIDTCTLPSCPNWGEWVLESVGDEPKLKQAYKRQVAAWKFGGRKR